VIAARYVQPSDDESKQFNGSEPDDQECKGYRVVFEPNTHGFLPRLSQLTPFGQCPKSSMVPSARESSKELGVNRH